jgi:hypothetical protein
MPNWTVTKLKHVLADGGVVSVCWEVESDTVTVNGTPYTEITAGENQFTYDASSADFIPYDDLTEDVVLSWVWDTSLTGVDKTLIETELQAGLPSPDNTAIVSGLPWE